MSVFIEISRQHDLADFTFEQAIVQAYQATDGVRFDQAWSDRSRNDQAYFLFLFTRLEKAINDAFSELLSIRNVGVWSDVRSWSVWEGRKLSDIALMQKVSMLLEKGKRDYNDVKKFYDGRNSIAHGDAFDEPFAITVVAQRMHEIAGNFVKT